MSVVAGVTDSLPLLATYHLTTVAIIVLVTAVVAPTLSWMCKRFLLWRGRSESAASVFSRMLQWLVVAVGFGACITALFPSVEPVNLLGGVGVLTIAAGIAFQTILGNMFAGVILLARERVNVGDQISVNKIAGVVTEITLVSTVVKAFDGHLVLVPNSIVHQNIVTIQTGFQRVRSSLSIEIDDCPNASHFAAVKDALERAALSVPAVLRDPAPKALLADLVQGGACIELTFWSGASQLEAKESRDQVLTAVVTHLAELGVERRDPSLVITFDDITTNRTTTTTGVAMSDPRTAEQAAENTHTTTSAQTAVNPLDDLSKPAVPREDIDKHDSHHANPAAASR